MHGCSPVNLTLKFAVFNCGQEKRYPGKLNKRRLDQDITKQEKAVYEAEK